MLKKHGLAWEDVLPILETIDTVEEIQQAIEHPEAFMRELATASAPAARKWALAKARPRIEPALKRHGLAWEDVLPILETIARPFARNGDRDTVECLQPRLEP